LEVGGVADEPKVYLTVANASGTALRAEVWMHTEDMPAGKRNLLGLELVELFEWRPRLMKA
jgi:hypothetical protein